MAVEGGEEEGCYCMKGESSPIKSSGNDTSGVLSLLSLCTRRCLRFCTLKFVQCFQFLTVFVNGLKMVKF